VLLSIDARMALAATLPLVLVTVATAVGECVRWPHRRAASSQATSQVTGAIGDIVAAAQALQARGQERTVAHLRRLNERRRTAVLSDRLLTQALDAITANTVTSARR
jgi:ATP-binding cassette subfamily B protein